MQNLTVELCHLVAQYSDASALSSLRLTSRDMDSKTRRAQAENCFIEKGFLVSSYESLKAAIKISWNPRFGPHMRTVYLFIDVPQVLSYRLERIMEVYLLTQFFGALKFWAKVERIVITDLESTSKPHPVGLCRALVHVHPDIRDPREFHAVIEALAKMDLPLRSLAARFKNYSICLNARWSSMRPLYQKVFARLQDLELRLWIDTYSRALTRSYAAAFGRLLGRRNASQLKTLYLRLDTDKDHGSDLDGVRFLKIGCFEILLGLYLQGGIGVHRGSAIPWVQGMKCRAIVFHMRDLPRSGMLFETRGRECFCLVDCNGELRREGVRGEEAVGRAVVEVEESEREWQRAVLEDLRIEEEERRAEEERASREAIAEMDEKMEDVE